MRSRPHKARLAKRTTTHPPHRSADAVRAREAEAADVLRRAGDASTARCAARCAELERKCEDSERCALTAERRAVQLTPRSRGVCVSINLERETSGF